MPEYHELAKYYDLMNREYVPYPKHFSFIEGAFEKYQMKVSKILDLACGTGTHSIHFAKRGYEVVGIDLSKDMLDVARQKAKTEGVRAEFLEGDIRDLRFDRGFDVVLCINQAAMFCTSHSDIEGLIISAKKALMEGGVLIIDFLSWYSTSEGLNKESAHSEGLEIECFRKEKYDEMRQVLIDDATYFVTEGGVISRFESHHEARIFYPQEMLFYLTSIGSFEILGLHECWNLEGPPIGPYLVVVARRT
jgi:ubiquinone/menaquinone biosynthesis C-methylase UbiE